VSIAGITFDLETQGVDTENDKIVTAFIGEIDSAGREVWRKEWLIDQGEPVPEGAAAVHGWTTERIRATPAARTDVRTAVLEIASTIYEHCARAGKPLMGMNLQYDCSMLDAELRRYELPRLHYGLIANPIHVLDARVLDTHYDRYRKGKRKLINLAEHYQVQLTEDDAHDASFDAIASGRIIQAIARKHIPYLQAIAEQGGDLEETLRTLHNSQIQWHRDWARGYEQYLAKQNKQETIDGGWPLSNRARNAAQNTN